MAIPGMPTILKCTRCGTDVKKKEVILGRAVGIDETTCICPTCLPRWNELQLRRKGKSPLSDDENFVALIQAAAEDKAVKSKLLAIAGLDAFHRESLINSFVHTLNLSCAPRELIDAISALKDDDVALKVIDVLK